MQSKMVEGVKKRALGAGSSKPMSVKASLFSDGSGRGFILKNRYNNPAKMGRDKSASRLTLKNNTVIGGDGIKASDSAEKILKTEILLIIKCGMTEAKMEFVRCTKMQNSRPKENV